MAAAGTAAAWPAPTRAAACLAAARDRQRHLLRAAGRLHLAPAARQLPAPAHCLLLVRPAARRWRIRGDQPSPGDARPRALRPRGQPDGGGNRQPERQDLRERRPARLRRGQEDQRPQASRHGGHRWARPDAGQPSGQHPGPRRCAAADARLTLPLALRAARLHGQRLRRGARRRCHRDPRRDRAQAQGADRLCRPDERVDEAVRDFWNGKVTPRPMGSA